MSLINAFPSGVTSNDRVELCRFTASGIFNPASYPTSDGLYDVYIVGGGGGKYQSTHWNEFRGCNGGGGGYAKLIKDISITSSMTVTIGAAGEGSTTVSSTTEGTDGGTTTFGAYSAAGGKHGTSTAGGDGGCGGAGFNGLMGGVDGHDGSYGEFARYGQSTRTTSTAGTGGGDTDYCPRNPYDNKSYGVGGNGTIVCGNNSSYDYTSCGYMLPTNYNAGRGGGSGGDALAGICIIYGRPKY